MGQALSSTEFVEEFPLAVLAPNVRFSTLLDGFDVAGVSGFGFRLAGTIPAGDPTVRDGGSPIESTNAGCFPLSKPPSRLGFVMVCTLYDLIDPALLCHSHSPPPLVGENNTTGGAGAAGRRRQLERVAQGWFRVTPQSTDWFGPWGNSLESGTVSDTLDVDGLFEDCWPDCDGDSMLAGTGMVFVAKAFTAIGQPIVDRHHILVVSRFVVAHVSDDDARFDQFELEILVLGALERSIAWVQSFERMFWGHRARTLGNCSVSESAVLSGLRPNPCWALERTIAWLVAAVAGHIE